MPVNGFKTPFWIPFETYEIDLAVAPDVLACTISAPDPTVATVRNVTVAITELAGTVSAPDPTVLAVKNASTTAAELVVTASVQDPTVVAVQNVAIAAAVLDVAGSIQAPTILAVKNVTIAAAVLDVTSSVQAPSVLLDMQVQAAVLEVALALQQPAVAIGVSIVPDVLALTISAQGVTIVNDQNASIAAQVANIVAQVLSPGVLAVRNVIISDAGRVIISSLGSARALASIEGPPPVYTSDQAADDLTGDDTRDAIIFTCQADQTSESRAAEQIIFNRSAIDG